MKQIGLGLLYLFVVLVYPLNGTAKDIDSAKSSAQIQRLIQHSKQAIQKGQLAYALKLNDKAHASAQTLGDTKLLLETHLNYNLIYSLKGQSAAVIDNGTKALQLTRETNNLVARARLLLSIGGAYAELGDNKQAMKNYFTALHLYQSLDDPKGIAAALNNISASYENMGNHEKSLEYLLRALEVSRKADDREGTALILSNLAQEARQEQDFVTAREYLKEALTLLESTPKPSEKNPVYRAFALIELARVHLAQHHDQEAAKVLAKAKQLCQAHGYDKSLFWVLSLEAELYLDKRQYTKALELVEQALHLAQDNHMAPEITEIYRLRSRIRAAQKHYKQALDDLNTFVERRLAEFKESNARQTLAMQALFDAKEKQREIEELKQKQKLQNLQLKKQENREQALLFAVLSIGSMTLVLLMLLYALRHSKRTIARQNQALSAAIAEVEQLARQDTLTHLLNRRGFLEFMEYELLQQKQTQRPLAIVIADIDHFKKLNDTYGHECGDKVLMETAQYLKDNTRKQDYICRWGGEEFLIMMPNTNQHQALMLVERLRLNLSKQNFVCAAQPIKITMTFGIAICQPGEIADHCIARADQALYEGKTSGRNKAVLAGLPT